MGAGHNSVFVKVAVQCFANSFVVNHCLVLRISIVGDNPHFRQSVKRYEPFFYN